MKKSRFTEEQIAYALKQAHHGELDPNPRVREQSHMI